MPRRMAFEEHYQAGKAGLFDQKYDMFKRVRWEPELKDVARGFYGKIQPQDKPGYRLEDIALRNAGWYLEMGFARGVISGNYGLYSWEDKVVGMNEMPEGLKLSPDDPRHNARIVKKAAKLYGASGVGISKLDRRWIYSKGYNLVAREEYEINIPDEYQYVITMAVPMEYDFYRYAPTFSAGGSTGEGYSKMAYTGGLMGQFIRQLGYKAIPSGNDTAMSVPYALQAGLGELGRNGILITRKLGPS